MYFWEALIELVETILDFSLLQVEVLGSEQTCKTCEGKVECRERVFRVGLPCFESEMKDEESRPT